MGKRCYGGLSPSNSEATRRCDAMVKAEISNPNSSEGIEFCTKECPHTVCILFEHIGGKKSTEKKKARQSTVLLTQGLTVEEIAKHYGVTVRCISRDLREEYLRCRKE